MLYFLENCIRLSFALSKNYDNLDKFIGNLDISNSPGGASSFYSIYKNLTHSKTRGHPYKLYSLWRRSQIAALLSMLLLMILSHIHIHIYSALSQPSRNFKNVKFG